MGETVFTTLCYIEREGQYLMLHRTGKKKDGNQDKWIGIGGHVEQGESPEECLLREVREETGLTLLEWRFRGIVTFTSDQWPGEYMCLYTGGSFQEEAPSKPGESFFCREGDLKWMDKREVPRQKIWDGDRIFLRLLEEDSPFFSLKLSYEGERLVYAALDGKELELFGLCSPDGTPNGHVTDRETAHAWGLMHPTAHVWVVRKGLSGKWELLLQKRSSRKDSFPGCYDTSSAGHIRAGEEKLSSALRELSEELGIRAEPEDLSYAGFFDSGDILAEFRGKPFHDREISHLYVYEKPVEEENLKLQEEEVDGVLWVSYEECLAWVKAQDPKICTNIESLEILGNYLNKKETL